MNTVAKFALGLALNVLLSVVIGRIAGWLVVKFYERLEAREDAASARAVGMTDEEWSAAMKQAIEDGDPRVGRA